MNQIGNLSEIDKEWTAELTKIKTLQELVDLCRRYELVAGDALDLVYKFDQVRFQKFMKAMWNERHGKFSNSEDAAIILMPAAMFKVSIVADQFKVPWELAYNRLVQTERIRIKDGRAIADF